MTLNPFRSSGVRNIWDYRDEPESLRSLIGFFWRTLLLAAFVLLVFTIWFGFQELDAAAQAESVQTTQSAPPPPLDPTQLQTTLSALSARQANYGTLASSSLPAIVDPSK